MRAAVTPFATMVEKKVASVISQVTRKTPAPSYPTVPDLDLFPPMGTTNPVPPAKTPNSTIIK